LLLNISITKWVDFHSPPEIKLYVLQIEADSSRFLLQITRAFPLQIDK
jgi:hypothetical protein